ncbi:mycofactocin system protein MftB [Halodesulfurarchaeum formicicum]|uniref:Mycofactocin system protein MftB n=1 Tax=Halodesulfurarchaeum formicicum TaxID=1873524 RepID=A0A1D8S273_9EURY|nr:mycofactocin biosynthesis chaperone MftB2 [Halodesulfurarchaeum formicicum]AOW79433.1 mycofactocin system protein MftB [Halodesulfurarchaeum formicicum]APE94686.1 mycofactocin system protein MftB [Halodesulfurarchaeum formicicum]
MGKTVSKPEYIKYRREDEYGLVYDHENYGYEDATLSTVDERIISCLEYVEDRSAIELEALQDEFSPEVIEVARKKGYIYVT